MTIPKNCKVGEIQQKMVNYLTTFMRPNTALNYKSFVVIIAGNPGNFLTDFERYLIQDYQFDVKVCFYFFHINQSQKDTLELREADNHEVKIFEPENPFTYIRSIFSALEQSVQGQPQEALVQLEQFTTALMWNLYQTEEQNNFVMNRVRLLEKENTSLIREKLNLENVKQMLQYNIPM
jgi:hypothetical protein